MQDFKSIKDIHTNLLKWFFNYGRHWIPWKLKQDGSLPKPGEYVSPYGVWIAEVMLQQTQVKVVLPYWNKWMKTFPTLLDLYLVDEKEVLILWQGLGYYSRAKRIYICSKILINQIGKDLIDDFSLWPNTLEQWTELPGIGRTTAGSILSSAFDLPYPILDANVKRVISRLLAIDGNLTQDQKTLWDFSNQLVSIKSPRNINQALMDFGTKVCTVIKPSCKCCPISNYCLSYIKYDPVDYPKKILKTPRNVEEIGIGLVFNKNGELLIDQRPENKSMGGMWEFPGGKKEPHETIQETIEREIYEELGIHIKIGKKLISFEHFYSHKKLNFTVYICEFVSGNPKPLASQKLLWVSPKKLKDFPFPLANTKIISALNKHLSLEA